MNKFKIFTSFVLCFLYFSISAQNNNLTTTLKNHVNYLASDSLEGRGLGTTGKLYAEIYIMDKFSSIGLSVLDGLEDYSQPFSFKYGSARVNATNIIGKIEGSDPVLKNEYIVLGAHYDHIGWSDKNGKKEIFNGADDNASGVATLIEVAKYLKENQNSLKRSIIIAAFDAEESGLLGSKHFVSNATMPIESIKAMFSIDMVGMYSANKGLELRGIDLLENGKEILKDSNKNNTTIAKADDKMEGRTDTKPFLDKGIPAIHAFTGLKSPYHKPEDTAEKLDYEGMTEVCELMMILSSNLANHNTLAASKTITKAPESKKDPAFRFGYKFGFGTSHINYIDENFRGKKSFSFETGLYSSIKLNKLFYLRPEAIYEFSNLKYIEDKFKLHSLTIPIQLVFKSPYINDYSPRLSLGFGGFYSNHFSVKSDTFDKKHFNNDYGICVSTGLDFSKMALNVIWRFSNNPLLEESEAILKNHRCSAKLAWSIRF